MLNSAKAVCNDQTKHLLQQVHSAYVDMNKKYNRNNMLETSNTLREPVSTHKPPSLIRHSIESCWRDLSF